MRQRIFATASLLAAGFALTAAPVLAEQAAHFGGSAQLDYQEAFRERDRQTMLRGLNTEIAFRIETDVHDRLSFTGKVCYGCHGFELDQASLEARPHPLANLQVGRLPVPFGEFSLRHDPTSHNLPTKPIAYEMGRMARYGPSEFNLGVLPVPYVDNAAVFFGNWWPKDWLQVYYAAYLAAGLKGSNDLDFIQQRTDRRDNNRDTARGGRLLATLSDAPWLPQAAHDISLGASYMEGAYDERARLRYQIYGADATVRLWRMTLRGEYLVRKTDIDPDLPGYSIPVVDPFVTKTGWYGEADMPVAPWLDVIYRVDGLERNGVPLPGSILTSTDSAILRHTGGVVLKPMDAFMVKISYERWQFTEFPDIDVGRLAVAGTF